jgi:hypothetical protein
MFIEVSNKVVIDLFSACFALIGSDTTLSDNCNQLMEANINISTTVRTLIQEIAVRKSTVSDERVVDV